MSDIPMVLCYQGRPITELSREELIEALEVAAAELEQERDGHSRTREMYKLILSRR
jgi:hypothetical protein